MDILPGKGIRVSLADYNRLRAFQSSGELWGREQQDLLRNATGLSRFLPEVNEDPASGTALFQLTVDGREVVSTSKVRQVRDIPTQEVRDFEECLTRLKELTQSKDRKTDLTKADVIRAFRLPDPFIQPEFYRVYKHGGRRRLLVLWGCESVQGSSVDPMMATHRLEKRQDSYGPLRAAALVAALLLLLLAGFLFWPKKEKPVAQTPADGVTPAATQPTTNPATNPATGPNAVAGPNARQRAASPAGPRVASADRAATSSQTPATKPAATPPPTASAEPATRPAVARASGSSPTTAPSLTTNSNPSPATNAAVAVVPTPSPTRDAELTHSPTPPPATNPAVAETRNPSPATHPALAVAPSPSPTTDPAAAGHSTRAPAVASVPVSPATNPAVAENRKPPVATNPPATNPSPAVASTPPTQGPLASNTNPPRPQTTPPTSPADPATASPAGPHPAAARLPADARATTAPALVARSNPTPTPPALEPSPSPSNQKPPADPNADPSSQGPLARPNPSPGSSQAAQPEPRTSRSVAFVPSTEPAEPERRDPITGDLWPKVQIAKNSIGNRAPIDESKLLLVILSVRGANDPGVRAVKRIAKWSWLIDGIHRHGSNDSESAIELHISDGIHTIQVSGTTPEGQLVTKVNTLRVLVRGDAALDE
jgi:hypothetical protein